ncbi:hypothetical protein BJP37_02390 [Moorena bouillonii PNG]|uniref:Uncharacterized protein n=1 Tax=Moorena bouillonii PNG TaxID=568701 RepID=A0A1U7MWF9_9CYAN|nr:hypothetical protein BJP37_02390 [Moorena bouillonii PNG]
MQGGWLFLRVSLRLEHFTITVDSFALIYTNLSTNDPDLPRLNWVIANPLAISYQLSAISYQLFNQTGKHSFNLCYLY